MNDYPSKAEFEAAIGSEFIMQLDDGAAVPVRLKRCDTKTDTPLQECFSLIFVAPDETPPVQKLWPLKHALLGEMSIFLVPVKRDPAGLYFEAVFNRLRA
jgi:hypothetical protein